MKESSERHLEDGNHDQDIFWASARAKRRRNEHVARKNPRGHASWASPVSAPIPDSMDTPRWTRLYAIASHIGVYTAVRPTQVQWNGGRSIANCDFRMPPGLSRKVFKFLMLDNCPRSQNYGNFSNLWDCPILCNFNLTLASA